MWIVRLAYFNLDIGSFLKRGSGLRALRSITALSLGAVLFRDNRKTDEEVHAPTSSPAVVRVATCLPLR
jgi:hypothetical protein